MRASKVWCCEMRKERPNTRARRFVHLGKPSEMFIEQKKFSVHPPQRCRPKHVNKQG